jgi:hypothetical protein
MPTLFDFATEISFVEEAPDRFSIEPEEMFFLCQTCGALSTVCPVFEAERASESLIVTAFGKSQLHEIIVRENALLLGSKGLDDAVTTIVDHFFVGPSTEPASWAGVVKHVFRAARSILWMNDFPARLRSEWAAYLRLRQERLGF